MFPFFNQIITIHDIIPVRFPDLIPRMKYYFYYNLPIILKNSRAIICDSDNTKKDVISYYGIKDKPISGYFEEILTIKTGEKEDKFPLKIRIYGRILPK